MKSAIDVLQDFFVRKSGNADIKSANTMIRAEAACCLIPHTLRTNGNFSADKRVRQLPNLSVKRSGKLGEFLFTHDTSLVKRACLRGFFRTCLLRSTNPLQSLDYI